MYDVVIIGGGPAGMTAALYTRRNGKTCLVIEKTGFGGQITHSPRVENYPGHASISGSKLADQMLEQITAQGAEITYETVIGVVEERGRMGKDDSFMIHTADGNVYEGRTVIFATGVKHRMLGLPGEEGLIGDGVSFCAVCDGDFYSGRTVCVAGGGNSAFQEAILLAEKCAKVIMLQDLPYFTAEAKLQETLMSRPNVEYHTDMRITGLQINGGELCGVEAVNANTGAAAVYPCDGLFVAIGLIPENDAFTNIADLDAYGYFDADERCLTQTPGAFVAGDCRTKEIRQVTTAAADGAVAALAACRYINSDT